jgi:hypothetical protein
LAGLLFAYILLGAFGSPHQPTARVTAERQRVMAEGAERSRALVAQFDQSERQRIIDEAAHCSALYRQGLSCYGGSVPRTRNSSRLDELESRVSDLEARSDE